MSVVGYQWECQGRDVSECGAVESISVGGAVWGGCFLPVNGVIVVQDAGSAGSVEH